MKRAANRRLRVFLGPVEIAGHYSRLARGLREVGVDAVAVDLSGHAFRYDEGQRLAPIITAAIALSARLQRPGGSRGRVLERLADRLIRIALVAWCLARFDAFIFGFGMTLLGGRELPLLRLLGKRVVFVFNGSDARPPYVDGADMAASLGRTIDDCIRLAGRKKANIRRIERYADAVVSQPTFSHFFEHPVVDFFRLGVPWTAAPPPVHQPRDPGEIRILHSPSNPEVKGSEQIRETVDDLRGEGLPIRLIELRGVTNAVVRSEIAQADFVIDQIYSDAPMVGFATEAAAAGVPAVVGGYAWPDLRQIYPDGAMPPVEQCHPDELAAAIRRLAEDPEHRRGLGADARAFVEGPWALKRIAERYLAVLRGEVPPEWMFDPRGLRYVGGVGLTEERARQLVREVIEHGGVGALQLGDKPEVERAFLRFAAGEQAT